jgi:Ca2+/Na+ antiporter
MSKTITVRYTPNQHDYATVLRYFIWQRTSTRVSLLFLLVAFGLVLSVIVSRGFKPTLFEVIWLLLPPLFVIYIFYYQPAQMARKAAQTDELVAEATWEVSESGVQISSQYRSTHLDWDSLDRLLKTKEYTLLLSKSNKNAFRFLPVRAFTSAEEQEEFLEIVSRNLAASKSS